MKLELEPLSLNTSSCPKKCSIEHDMTRLEIPKVVPLLSHDVACLTDVDCLSFQPPSLPAVGGDERSAATTSGSLLAESMTFESAPSQFGLHIVEHL